MPPDLRSLLQRPRAVYAAIFAAGLAAAFLTFNAELSRSGDNAEYIILGRSLAQGEGMRVISHPSPEPSRRFPPLFPLVLAAVEWMAPGKVVLMKALVSVTFALSLVLVFRLFQEHEGTGIAAAATTACLVSPHLLRSASVVMSEIPFMLVSLSCLLAAGNGTQNWRRTWPVVLLAVMAFYVRTAGIALMAAVTVLFCVRRNWRASALVAVVSGLAVMPWGMYLQYLGGSAYASELLLADPYDPESGLPGLGGFASRIARNTAAYATDHLGSLLNPLLLEMPDSYAVLNAFVQGAGILCLLAYFWASRRSRLDPIRIYLPVYAAMLVCWPEVWSSARFLLPAAPLIYGAIFAGGREILSRLPLRASVRRYAAAGAVLALSTYYIGVDVAMVRARQPDPAWEEYERAARWIGEHAPDSTIVACRKPHLMYLHSGKRALRYAFSPPPDLVRHLYANGADVLVVDGLGEFDSNRRFLFPAAREYGELLQQVYRSDYVTVAALHPDPGDRYGRLADAHLEEGDTLAAIESLRKLNALFPEDATSLRRLEDLAKRGK